MNHFDFQPPLSVTLSNRPASSRGGGGHNHGQGGRSQNHFRRGMGPPVQLKASQRCVAVMCSPCVIFLLLTLALTSLASVLLYVALTSQYWELMIYDSDKLNQILHSNDTFSEQDTVTWLFDGKLPVVTFHKAPPSVVYLLPIRSGVWISCIDVTDIEFAELVLKGYEKPHCVEHLQPDRPSRPTEVRVSWQHRMQNLAIACAYVCLILQGAAIPVGLFGTLRRQISAVLVTGVLYILSATFALFTLTIVHLKHKNRSDPEPLDVWTQLITSHPEFNPARIIFHGWSLQLAWAGSFVCILASIMWILLSKMMRYNPMSI